MHSTVVIMMKRTRSRLPRPLSWPEAGAEGDANNAGMADADEEHARVGHQHHSTV